MKAIFDTLKINYILIEEDEQEATVDAVITQNNQSINTKLVLDFTDLNRLFLKLNMQGVEVSISENFTCYQTEKGSIYTLSMSDFGWEDVFIEQFAPMHEVKQIRA